MSNGPVFPVSNGNIITSTGGTVSVVVDGTSANENLLLDSWGIFTVEDRSVALLNCSGLTYNDGGGSDNIAAAGPIMLTLNMGGGVDDLNVGMLSYATVNIGASGGDLTIDGNGNTTINLGSGNVNVQYATVADQLAHARGKLATASISGTIYNDLNGNGRRGPHDVGLAGRIVYIDWNGNGKVDPGEPTALTNAHGAYQFAGLLAGTYRVGEVVAAGWRATTSAESRVALGAAVDDVIDFGQTQSALIAGSVFRDRNGDGKPDNGDIGLANWLVFIDMNHDGRFNKGDLSTLTDRYGHYQFSVSAGSYRVLEVVGKGYKQTNPGPSGYRLTLSAGQVLRNRNFANRISR